MDTVSIDVFTREVLGKKVSTLRREGITPLHLYGNGMPSQALQADTVAITRLINHVGRHIPAYIKLDGAKEQELVFVREIQRHPITNRILHADLYRVDVTERGRGEVPLTLVGEAPAVRAYRGILTQNLHHLSVECLPMDMPERIDVDISLLEELDQYVRVSDISLASGITILSDPEEIVARVSPPRVTGGEVRGERDMPVGETPETPRDREEGNI
jgi:large subunit ribosomal protein L25